MMYSGNEYIDRLIYATDAQYIQQLIKIDLKISIIALWSCLDIWVL